MTPRSARLPFDFRLSTFDLSSYDEPRLAETQCLDPERHAQHRVTVRIDSEPRPEHAPRQLLEPREILVQIGVGPLQHDLEAVLVDRALGRLGRRLRSLVG